MRRRKADAVYRAPVLPKGYRFKVYLYGGDILTVRVQKFDDPGAGWVDTHHVTTAARRTTFAVANAMASLAVQVEKDANVSPLLGVYNPGDPLP